MENKFKEFSSKENMGIRIKIKKLNRIPVFELHGRISGSDAIKLSKKLESFLKKPFDKVILDLSRIDYIDSNWLGVFIYSLRLYKELNKDIVFYITSDFIKEIFQNSNINTIATIIESLDDI